MTTVVENTAYLIFEAAGARYATRVKHVFEILWLPELTPIAQAPFDIAGIFNLRGRIVSVINLQQRLGYRAEPYRTTDKIVVLSDGENLAGLIVNAVHEVRQLSSLEISDAPAYGLEDGRASLYISHVARLGDRLVTVLDEEKLLHYSQGLHEKILEVNQSLEALGERETTVPERQLPVFCPEATQAEREIFRKRAAALLRSARTREAEDPRSVAVVAFGRELFGLPLDNVMEFTDVRQPTPIPCTPEHIVGCMNLRGEILTLVDIRDLLQLTQRGQGARVVVVRLKDLFVGLVVDDVLDILSVPATAIRPVPAAVRAAGQDFVQGVCEYGDRAVTLLDLEKILLEGNLVVLQEA